MPLARFLHGTVFAVLRRRAVGKPVFKRQGRMRGAPLGWPLLSFGSRLSICSGPVTLQVREGLLRGGSKQQGRAVAGGHCPVLPDLE